MVELDNVVIEAAKKFFPNFSLRCFQGVKKRPTLSDFSFHSERRRGRPMTGEVPENPALRELSIGALFVTCA